MIEKVYNDMGLVIYRHTTQNNALDPYNTQNYVTFLVFYKGKYLGFYLTFEEALKNKEK